jgi:hypothetical protein
MENILRRYVYQMELLGFDKENTKIKGPDITDIIQAV